jgi:hypothetical protein
MGKLFKITFIDTVNFKVLQRQLHLCEDIKLYRITIYTKQY